MNSHSLDIKQSSLERLREAFPNVFSEGKIDLEKFKAAFCEDIDFQSECYSLLPRLFLARNLLPRTEEQNERYDNPDNDLRGAWTSVALQAKSGSSTYEIIFPNGVKWKPVEGTFPRLSKESLLRAYEEGRLWFGKEGRNVPRLKKYLSEVKDGIISNSVWLNETVGSTQLAKEEPASLAMLTAGRKAA